MNIQLEAQQKLLVEIFLEWKTLSDQLAVNKVRSEEISTILEGLEGQADAAERLKYLDAEEADHKNKLTRAEEEFQSEILTNGTNSLLVGAFPELKNQVAAFSIEIAEKVVRGELAADDKQKALAGKLAEEINLN